MNRNAEWFGIWEGEGGLLSVNKVTGYGVQGTFTESSSGQARGRCLSWEEFRAVKWERNRYSAAWKKRCFQ